MTEDGLVLVVANDNETNVIKFPRLNRAREHEELLVCLNCDKTSYYYPHEDRCLFCKTDGMLDEPEI